MKQRTVYSEVTAAHLVIGRPEPFADVLEVQHLDLQGEFLIENVRSFSFKLAANESVDRIRLPTW